MSSDIWFTSDSHFGHKNILKFTDKDGNLIRKFSSVDEMDEHMIDQWNKNVKKGDKVYHLGDITFDKSKFPKIINGLNGSKRITFGNHDDIKFLSSGGWFQKQYVTRRFDEFGFMCSHYPLHHEQFFNHRQNKQMFCIHGHVHGNSLDDKLFINVSVEVTDYRPLHIDEILQIIKDRS